MAVLAYTLIFREYVKTRSFPTPSCTSAGVGAASHQRSMWNIFRKSRFYISVWLILTFFLFMVVPDLTYLTVMKIKGQVSETLSILCFISYAISNIIDFFIYIFMDKRARMLLLNTFCCWKERTHPVVNNNERSTAFTIK